MSKPIGPREQQLRDMREQQFERSKSAPREVGALREKVAAIPARKAKAVKKGRFAAKRGG